MVLVKPTTVMQWHRRGFRLAWRWRSGALRPGQPKDRLRHPRFDPSNEYGKSALGRAADPRRVAQARNQGESSSCWALHAVAAQDRDTSYGHGVRDRVRMIGIEEVITAPRSPWQTPFVERAIDSIHRECLDHVIIINERHLRRVLYFRYSHESRTHLSLDKDCPRPVLYCHPPLAKSSSSRNSTVSTIGMNVEPPKIVHGGTVMLALV